MDPTKLQNNVAKKVKTKQFPNSKKSSYKIYVFLQIGVRDVFVVVILAGVWIQYTVAILKKMPIVQSFKNVVKNTLA